MRLFGVRISTEISKRLRWIWDDFLARVLKKTREIVRGIGSYLQRNQKILERSDSYFRNNSISIVNIISLVTSNNEI